MDFYDESLQAHILRKMRRERIQDFSETELERVFADFDVPEEAYQEVVAFLIDSGLTIEDIYDDGFN